jgi:hypothetical protein
VAAHLLLLSWTKLIKHCPLTFDLQLHHSMLLQYVSNALLLLLVVGMAIIFVCTALQLSGLPCTV